MFRFNASVMYIFYNQSCDMSDIISRLARSSLEKCYVGIQESSERTYFLLRFSGIKRGSITTPLAALELPSALIPLNTPQFSPFSHARYLRYVGSHCTQIALARRLPQREGSIKFKGLRKSFFRSVLRSRCFPCVRL